MFFSLGAETAFTHHNLITIIIINYSGKGGCEPHWCSGLYYVFMAIFQNSHLIAFSGAGGNYLPACVCVCGGGLHLQSSLACAVKCKQTISELKITHPLSNRPDDLCSPDAGSPKRLGHLFFIIGAI